MKIVVMDCKCFSYHSYYFFFFIVQFLNGLDVTSNFFKGMSKSPRGLLNQIGYLFYERGSPQ